MAKFDVTGDQDLGIDKQMFEIKRQIRQKGGSPINPELVARDLQRIIEGRFSAAERSSDFLELLSKGESLVIDECNGMETIASASDVFKCYIESSFSSEDLNVAQSNKKETAVQVYEMVKEATSAQLFCSLNFNLDKLCLTQAQIKSFCKKYPHWLLPDKKATFFLCKPICRYFVIGVNVMDKGALHVFSADLGTSVIWTPDVPHRIVVPQLLG